MQDSSSLAQRIQTLEAELDSLKRSLNTTTVRAQSFILSTDDGTPRGWMAVNEDGAPEFKLAAEDGSVRAEFVLDESESPRLIMFDDSGRQRAALQVSDSGEPSAYLWDETGVNMIALRTTDEGECEVILNGGVKGRLRLATNPEGAARLELLDEDSQARLVLRSGEDRPAEVLLLDATGDTRAELYLETNDATGLQLHDYLEQRRMTVGLDYIGKPEVLLFDEDDSEVAALRPPVLDDEEGDEDALDDESEDDDPDLDDEEAPSVSVSTALAAASRQLPSSVGGLLGDAAVASLIYPTDLLDTWRAAMNHPRHKLQVFDRAFTYDNLIAVALVGCAREFNWQSNNIFGGSTDHQGVAVFAILINRTQKDIKSLDLSKLILVDDRGHQYSSSGSFFWAEEAGSFNSHASDIMGGARQEGFLLFPAMKRGSTRYVKAVLRDSFWVEEDFGERKYEITLGR